MWASAPLHRVALKREHPAVRQCELEPLGRAERHVRQLPVVCAVVLDAT